MTNQPDGALMSAAQTSLARLCGLCWMPDREVRVCLLAFKGAQSSQLWAS